MSTITEIMDFLEKMPGITVAAIAFELNISEKSAACAIWRARKHGLNIRICGSLKTQNHPYLYEVSDLPDVRVVKKGPVMGAQVRGRPPQDDLEAFMEKRRASMSAKIKPFRHWQDVAFFGAPQ